MSSSEDAKVPNSPRPLWHPLARSALYLAAYALLQISLSRALGAPAFLLSDGWFRKGGFASSTEILLVATAICLPPTVGMTWLFVRFLDRRTLASLGARGPEGGARTALRQLVTMPLATLALLGSWLALLLLLPASLAAVRAAGLRRGFSNGPALV